MDFVKCLESVKKEYETYNENQSFFCVDCDEMITDTDYVFVAIKDFEGKAIICDFANNLQNFEIDIETVKNYHQYTLTLLQDLIKELDKINDKEGIANRVKERMQRVYDKIATKKIVKPTFSKFDIQKYFNEVTKEIIEAYIDYLDYLQSQIEQKNKTAVNIVEMLNSFLQRINIYSVTCNDGDDWDELKFEPEINVIDNITDDKNKIDTIHKVYRYCYLIDYNSLGNSFVLYPGKTSIWKGR